MLGGIHSLASYGTLLLVAGGIGITHPMSYLHEVVTNFASRKTATRKVHLVWMIRTLGITSFRINFDSKENIERRKRGVQNNNI